MNVTATPRSEPQTLEKRLLNMFSAPEAPTELALQGRVLFRRQTLTDALAVCRAHSTPTFWRKYQKSGLRIVEAVEQAQAEIDSYRSDGLDDMADSSEGDLEDFKRVVGWPKPLRYWAAGTLLLELYESPELNY